MKMKIADIIKKSSIEDLAKIIGSVAAIHLYGFSAEVANKLENKEILKALQSEIEVDYKLTNADRIRSMSDEELAKFINAVSCNALFGNEECGYPFCNSMNGSFCNGNIDSETLDWLQSEVEE